MIISGRGASVPVVATSGVSGGNLVVRNDENFRVDY